MQDQWRWPCTAAPGRWLSTRPSAPPASHVAPRLVVVVTARRFVSCALPPGAASLWAACLINWEMISRGLTWSTVHLPVRLPLPTHLLRPLSRLCCPHASPLARIPPASPFARLAGSDPPAPPPLSQAPPPCPRTSRAATPQIAQGSFSAASVLWILAADIVVYALLAWYLDQVLPTSPTQRQHPLFFLKYMLRPKLLPAVLGSPAGERPLQVQRAGGEPEGRSAWGTRPWPTSRPAPLFTLGLRGPAAPHRTHHMRAYAQGGGTTCPSRSRPPLTRPPPRSTPQTPPPAPPWTAPWRRTTRPRAAGAAGSAARAAGRAGARRRRGSPWGPRRAFSSTAWSRCVRSLCLSSPFVLRPALSTHPRLSALAPWWRRLPSWGRGHKGEAVGARLCVWSADVPRARGLPGGGA